MTPEMDLPLDNHSPHVQVYAVLQATVGQYQLIGPGFLNILTDYVEGSTVHYLEAKNKQGQTLMLSRLRPDNGYEKQKGSVIAWRDAEQKEHSDLALSFSDENECDFIWRLVCQKIGKNYLQISGRGELEIPRQDNLTSILEQTHKSKDMIEYHILNSGQFMEGLANTFSAFQIAQDQMGMGMVGRILKSVLNNVDHRLVQKLFSDPAFDLLLKVQQFSCKIDFPSLCEANNSFKQLVPLPSVIAQKVQLIHRITFYRQNVLNLAKEGYFEHILIMTQTECYKELIIQLSRGDTLSLVLDAETSAIKPEEDKTEIASIDESKLQFLMECLMLLKQGQSDNNKRKLIQRMHNADVQQLAAHSLDHGIVKAIDFYVCLSQADPQSFLELLQREHPMRKEETLLNTLAIKFSEGTQEMRNSIIEIFNMLGESFKNQNTVQTIVQNFIQPIFTKCEDGKALLLLVSEVQNTLDSVNSLFQVILSHSILTKVTKFLKDNPRNKDSQLKAIKFMKRVLVENAFSMRKVVINSSSVLSRLNEEVIKSEFFKHCLQILTRNIIFNNIISSSMLQNLKLIADFPHFTVYQKYLQDNNHEQTELSQRKESNPIYNRILSASPKTMSAPDIHKANLEQQLQESYLMEENHHENSFIEPKIDKVRMEQLKDQMQSLRALTMQIEEQSRSIQRQKEDSEPREAGASRKRRKENEEGVPMFTIELKLDFDADEGNE